MTLRWVSSRSRIFYSSSLFIGGRGGGGECAVTNNMRFWCLDSLSGFTGAAQSNNSADSLHVHACIERTAGFSSAWISNKK